VVNVVDLMVLQPPPLHPHGLDDPDFDRLFTTRAPVIFAFHGYPAMIHKLTYRRRNHEQFHVRGYCEEGTTTTPFDMVVLNEMDRFRLALDAISRIPRFADLLGEATSQYAEAIARHTSYIREHGEDLPEVRNWRWTDGVPPHEMSPSTGTVAAPAVAPASSRPSSASQGLVDDHSSRS
jgi:xylulose-5-phosphate/fructose-6-phosphate phosphoketolase